jgi:hypothetical protein
MRGKGLLLLLLPLLATGCASPYRSDQGALLGGLGGAGLGAIVGNATGNTLAGAAIGGVAGAATGAIVGDQLDQIEARNRAEIAAHLGREVGPGAVTIDDVVAMSQAGVSEEVIANHVRIHGVAAPLQTADIIYLQNSGVGSRTIAAMQAPPAPRTVVREVPPPVIVEEYYYDPWCHYPHYHHHHRYHHGPRVSWGVGFSSRH